MIALQVAAGILLAYFVIVNQKKLLVWGGQLVSGLAMIAAIGAIIWAGWAGVQFVAKVVPSETVQKVLTMFGLIPVFILVGTGSVGLALLIGLIFRRSPEATSKAIWVVVDGGDKPSRKNDRDGKGCVYVFFGLTLLALGINYLLSFPVWAYTPIGGWNDQLYRYGMITAWKDGLSLLFCAGLWQWPWIPLGLYFLMRRFKAGTAKPDEQLGDIDA
jgi:hypothetical protein